MTFTTPVLLISGFQPVSESDPLLVKLMKGVVATCVQSSEDSIAALYGLLPAGPESTAALAWDMIARGEASPGPPASTAPLGSSNWAAAAASLARLGLPNNAYGPGSPQVADLGNTLNNALLQGIPVLLGVPDAESHGAGLLDQLTGQPQDLGVYGHALDIVGYDPAHGAYVVSDPNSAAAAAGGFVEYTLASLKAAGADSLVIPSAPPGASGGGGSGGTHLENLTLGTGTNPLDALGQLANALLPLAGVITNPVRLLKIALGSVLIFYGLFVAFQQPIQQAAIAGLKAAAA